MNFDAYYRKNKTYITYTDPRLKNILKIVEDHRPKKILDIGCGNGYLLKLIKEILPHSTLVGIDVYNTNIKGIKITTADINKGFPFRKDYFDLVIMGEVIEHLPDPDFILKDIRRILKKKGTLIISTPNLVSWANRIMMLCGIQPFYTETSTQKNLGRFYSFLGQGGKVQGHLKIFTYKSLEEILLKEKFKLEKMQGMTFYFPFPISLIDKLLSKFLSLSSDLLYTARKV